MKSWKRGRQFILTSGVLQYLTAILVIAITVTLFRIFGNREAYYIVALILLSEVSVLAIFLGIGPILLLQQ
jgi:positive regulator of sigma E activity